MHIVPWSPKQWHWPKPPQFYQCEPDVPDPAVNHSLLKHFPALSHRLAFACALWSSGSEPLMQCLMTESWYEVIFRSTVYRSVGWRLAFLAFTILFKERVFWDIVLPFVALHWKPTGKSHCNASACAALWCSGGVASSHKKAAQRNKSDRRRILECETSQLHLRRKALGS